MATGQCAVVYVAPLLGHDPSGLELSCRHRLLDPTYFEPSNPAGLVDRRLAIWRSRVSDSQRLDLRDKVFTTHWRCQGLKCGVSRSRLFTTRRRQPEFVVGTDVSDIRVVHPILVALFLRVPSGPKDATTFAAASLLGSMIRRKTTA